MTEQELTTFEIPKGYRSLEVGEIRQEGDYFWSDQSSTWKPTKEVGSPATIAHNGKTAVHQKCRTQANPKRGIRNMVKYG